MITIIIPKKIITSKVLCERPNPLTTSEYITTPYLNGSQCTFTGIITTPLAVFCAKYSTVGFIFALIQSREPPITSARLSATGPV
jgi:hypothetical protein